MPFCFRDLLFNFAYSINRYGMKIYAMIGSFVVCLALLFYSLGFCKQQRKGIVNSQVLTFFTLGVIGDVLATTLMIMGSTKGLFTFHGLLGYSALLGMCIDAFLMWRHKLKMGVNVKVGKVLNIYSRIAFFWWIVAFITGLLLVAFRHS